MDLVLNGHDHTYARGHIPVQEKENDQSGNFKTLYVTSVSGPKQYKVDLDKINNYENDGYLNIKTGEQTQFFQVIKIENDNLIYKAFTVLGDLFDEALIKKDFSNGLKSYFNETK